LPIIIAGPALIGAALGLPEGVGTSAARAAVLPAIVVGVALLTLPALYIGAAFFGVAPRAQAVVRSASGALKDMGIVFFGLAAPLVFLVAASTESTTVRILGQLAVSLGVVLGFRALYVRLFDRRSLRALTLFVCWAMVSFGIGAQLFVRGIGLS
jgi:ABC-type transport system involved in cytochrome c biogenesis permease subunit